MSNRRVPILNFQRMCFLNVGEGEFTRQAEADAGRYKLSAACIPVISMVCTRPLRSPPVGAAGSGQHSPAPSPT